MAGSAAQLTIRVLEPEQAQRALGVLGAAGVTATSPSPDTLMVDSSSGAAVNAMLGAQGIWASEITPVRPDLERAFLDLTAQPQETP
jgi:ABC-2 type transport system ATP-binding protein